MLVLSLAILNDLFLQTKRIIKFSESDGEKGKYLRFICDLIVCI